MNLTEVPSDVLVEAFCFLDVKNVAVASRACRRLRHCIFDNNVFWYRYMTTMYLLPPIVHSSDHKGYDEEVGHCWSDRDYRRMLFEHLFDNLRKEAWSKYNEDCLIASIRILQKTSMDLFQCSSTILELFADKQRVLAPYRVLPGEQHHTIADASESLLPDFGDDTLAIRRLLINAGLWKTL